MKVLRIIARLNVGGPARHVVWLTEGLRRQGCDVSLVTGVVPPGEDDMSYLASKSGIAPVVLPEMSREISLKDVLTVWKLYRLMLREQPDLVHTHTAKAGTVGRVAGLMYRYLRPTALVGKPRPCKFVHTYHGHVFHSYYGPRKTKMFLAIERILARLATDRIIVVSNQQRTEINEQFRVGHPGQFAVIPLGIDLSMFADWEARRLRLRKELNANEAEILIGIVGRLTEVKNHRLFIDVVARFKATAGDRRVRFLIVGDGLLRSALETQAMALGLKDDVIFLGTRNDPENFYPALDIVALTSVNEGTPLTLIEAMANARPVIATSVGGVVDLLGAEVAPSASGYTVCERGVAIRSNDIEGFCSGLLFLLENEDLRPTLGQRGRDFIEKNYAKERLIADTLALYKDVIGVAKESTEQMHVNDQTPNWRDSSA